jgi:hypothetical protein
MAHSGFALARLHANWSPDHIETIPQNQENSRPLLRKHERNLMFVFVSSPLSRFLFS